MNKNNIASRIIIRYTYALRVFIFRFGCMSWTDHGVVMVLPFKSEIKRYIRMKKKNYL